MPNIVPLVHVTYNAFMKKFDNNSAQLSTLRRKTKLSEGFFMYKDEYHLIDAFPLTGGQFTGNWRLGRIRLPVGIENTGEHDYIVEIYRRCMNKSSPVGLAFTRKLVDDAALAHTLRSLDRGLNVASYQSAWDIEHTDTFANLGFDLC